MIIVNWRSTRLTWLVRAGRIGDAVRQPGHATRYVRTAEPGEKPAHRGPMTGAFAPYCNSERTLAGSGADAPHLDNDVVHALATDRSD